MREDSSNLEVLGADYYNHHNWNGDFKVESKRQFSARDPTQSSVGYNDNISTSTTPRSLNTKLQPKHKLERRNPKYPRSVQDSRSMYKQKFRATRQNHRNISHDGIRKQTNKRKQVTRCTEVHAPLTWLSDNVKDEAILRAVRKTCNCISKKSGIYGKLNVWNKYQ